ncbi:type II secretion system protein [bacterium]|nr:type II secretion system protein [bacterium]
MRRAGMTLLEVMIYVVMALMASLAVGALFSLGRSAQKTTLSGYLVSGQTDTALRWIRRDLTETALVSVRTYPSPLKPEQAPGCSFVSARDISTNDTTQKLNISKYGKLLWTKNVFYSVKPGSDGRRGDLVRWENGLTVAEKDFVPRSTSTMPDAFSNNDARRVLLHDILLPKQKVPNLQDNTNYQSDDHGGFNVQFVRRTGGSDGVESLTPICPGDTSQPQVDANNTRLIYVRLEVLSDDKYKPSFYQLEFKVCPRY